MLETFTKRFLDELRKVESLDYTNVILAYSNALPDHSSVKEYIVLHILRTLEKMLSKVSLQPDRSKPNFYDVNLVDGYNLPVSVSSNPAEPKCSIGSCLKNLNNIFPQELWVLNRTEKVVACKCACLAFDHDMFCCRNYYGRPDKCKANMYLKLFKDACPSYFSYAFDSLAPLVSCTSRDYIMTFFPSKWGVQTISTT
ncbi:hypothetical protein GIB67_020655 [Kingdonia uniflora]|uniref:Uncharacterized protein n=1 Tax=Kingdonia uniflora TaxID=39325 RepID=A0A7J7M966_9MAGN|nr:hypothetical protein GIB67_020655 [Kingdonia uniflora]